MPQEIMLWCAAILCVIVVLHVIVLVVYGIGCVVKSWMEGGVR